MCVIAAGIQLMEHGEDGPFVSWYGHIYFDGYNIGTGEDCAKERQPKNKNIEWA